MDKKESRSPRTRAGGHMGGPHGHMAAGEKPGDFKGTVKKLLRFMGKYKAALVFVAVAAVASAVFSIIGPKILGGATTEIYTGLVGKISGTGGIDFQAIGRILLTLLCIYVVSSAFSYVQGLMMANVTQQMSYELRDMLCKKIHRLPMKYFDTYTHGEVISRVTNDIDTMAQSLNQVMTQVITAITILVGVLVMMFTISWLMTLVTLILLPISALLISAIMKRSQKYFRQQQEYLGHVNGQVEEIFSGQIVVKAFNAEEQVTKEFDETNATLYNSAWKSQFLSGLMHPLMMLVGNIGYVAVCILGGWLAANGTITVGSIQAFIQYVRNFTQPLSQVAQVMNMMQSATAAAERVFEFAEAEEEDITVETPAHIDGLEGRVVFDHVSFGYTPEKIIIRDFSAMVRQGQKVAIVGPTGAGKTTIVKLLMRFYDVNSGAIRVDGHDVRDFNRSELREMFGMVLQDTWLFSGTIMENIRYGRLDATDEEVIEAAKAARVHHFIMTEAQGYDTVLSEDAANLSAGQKQLLTIARAILANPPILILDEATSSVDTRTERRISKAMDTLIQGRTSFVIAHRLSTIRDADIILVMKDGDIVEQGDHETLMEQGGMYSELYNAQFS